MEVPTRSLNSGGPHEEFEQWRSPTQACLESIAAPAFTAFNAIYAQYPPYFVAHLAHRFFPPSERSGGEELACVRACENRTKRRLSRGMPAS